MWIEIQNSDTNSDEKAVKKDFITWYNKGILVGRHVKDNGKESKLYAIQSKKFGGPIPQGSIISDDDTLFIVTNSC